MEAKNEIIFTVFMWAGGLGLAFNFGLLYIIWNYFDNKISELWKSMTQHKQALSTEALEQERRFATKDDLDSLSDRMDTMHKETKTSLDHITTLIISGNKNRKDH